MAKTNHRPVYYLPRFNPADSFVVGKPFRLNGADLRSGEPFDRSLVTTRMLRQLYEGRRLIVVEDPAMDWVADRGPQSEPTLPSDSSKAPTEDSSPSLEVRHVGHGKFRVFRAGSAVTEAKPRAEADADLAALTLEIA